VAIKKSIHKLKMKMMKKIMQKITAKIYGQKLVQYGKKIIF
jgi:hypothetical protein